MKGKTGIRYWEFARELYNSSVMLTIRQTDENNLRYYLLKSITQGSDNIPGDHRFGTVFGCGNVTR